LSSVAGFIEQGDGLEATFAALADEYDGAGGREFAATGHDFSEGNDPGTRKRSDSRFRFFADVNEQKVHA
jgi:hypothetical protein